MIYQPAEDSYLLSEAIKKILEDKNKNIKILDMGSGTGIQAKICRDLGFENILAVDINPEAVGHIKKQGLNAILSDLFSNINSNKDKFDIILFNPPYLPEDKREPEDSKLNTTAGKKGYEIIIRFLKDAKIFLNENGRVLLLFSSLSQPDVILKKAKELDYKYKQLNNLRLDFEELFVYEFTNNL